MKIELTPKQTQVFTTRARHVLLGGSAGGGKSVAIKVAAIYYCMTIPNLTFYIFRDSRPQLMSNYMENGLSFPIMLYDQIKAGTVKINYNELIIKFIHNNSQIKMRHMSHINDAQDILGVEIAACAVDECTRMHPDLIRFIINRTRLGSMKEYIPDEIKHKFPFVLLASNPGGVSADMIKRWFVDAAPWGEEFISSEEFGEALSVFIPARLVDNPHMEESYAKAIKALGDPVKIKQMLEGDWSVSASTLMGHAFSRVHNVIKSLSKKDYEDFVIERCFDYGFSSPAACAWIGTLKEGRKFEMSFGGEKYFPKGTKVVIKEWQVCKYDKPDEGLRLSNKELAEGILSKEEIYELKGHVRIGPGDVFDKSGKGGFSIGEEMAQCGVSFTRPWKTPNSRAIGWSRMISMMLQAHQDIVEEPALIYAEDCVHAIRTIPLLPPDPKNPDDCISVGVDDHMPDAIRYGVNQGVKSAGYAKVTGL